MAWHGSQAFILGIFLTSALWQLVNFKWNSLFCPLLLFKCFSPFLFYCLSSPSLLFTLVLHYFLHFNSLVLVSWWLKHIPWHSVSLSSLLSPLPSISIVLSLYRQYLVFTYNSLFLVLSQNPLSLLHPLVTCIFSLCSFSVTQNSQSFTAIFLSSGPITPTREPATFHTNISSFQ